MFAFCIVAALAAVSSGLPLDSSANTHTPNGRVIGGNSTTIDQYPYQVILEEEGSLRCGGSIISKKVAITAAHCVKRLSGPNYGRHIRAGTSYPGEGGSVHEIENIVVHEDYYFVLLNDIALIFVKQPFEFDSTRQPIELRSSSEEIPEGATAVVSGYGYFTLEGLLPDQLQVADLQIVSKKICDEAYFMFGGVRPGQICAGTPGVGDKGSCNGDSGGPLVVDAQLAGLVSFSMACAHPDYPGVYTKVAHYYDWIVENGGLPA